MALPPLQLAAARRRLLLDPPLEQHGAHVDALAALAPTLPAITFLSLSKSVSRGLTTAGCLVPNGTADAQSLMGAAAECAALHSDTVDRHGVRLRRG